jgi:adenylate cyclase
MGDSALLFWGAPDPIESPARCCVEAALLCKSRLASLNDRWTSQGKGLTFQTSLGIDYGEVLVGNIGATERVNYTIVGDRVTLASRVERLNRTYGTRLLATRALIEALGKDINRYVVVKVDRTLLRGFREPIELYEIRGHRESAQEEETRFASDFNAAIAAFDRGDRDSALAGLAGLSEAFRRLPYVRRLEDRCRIKGEEREPSAKA